MGEVMSEMMSEVMVNYHRVAKQSPLLPVLILLDYNCCYSTE